MMSYPFLEQSKEATSSDAASDDPFPVSGTFKFLKNLFFCTPYQLTQKDGENRIPLFSLIDVSLNSYFKNLDILFSSCFNKNVHLKILQIRSPNS